MARNGSPWWSPISWIVQMLGDSAQMVQELIQGDELGTGFLQFVICMIPKSQVKLEPPLN